MTENERLTFRTDLGISIDKNEDCPTMSICWNCDIPPRKCKYFKDVIDKLAKYETIGTIDEFKALKEKSVAKKPDYEADGYADGVLAYDYAKCPICGHDFEYGINDWGCEYCSDCGQKLDWSE